MIKRGNNETVSTIQVTSSTIDAIDKLRKNNESNNQVLQNLLGSIGLLQSGVS